MESIKKFMRKPKNIYFSLLVLVTVVIGLASFSFSYYTDDTVDVKPLRLADVDTRLQCDQAKGGYVTVGAQETIEYTVYVQSNNAFDSQYKLYYETEANDVEVYTSKETIGNIEAYNILAYKITVANFETNPVKVKLGVAGGYTEADIDVPGKLIETK